MSTTTKTPPRNLKRPHRLQGWHLDDALENPGVGPLSRRVETWKLICSFLDVSLGHPPSQKPTILLLGTSSFLWRHIWDGALPRKVEIGKLICSFLDVSLRHPLDQILPKILSGSTTGLEQSSSFARGNISFFCSGSRRLLNPIRYVATNFRETCFNQWFSF